jgi:hypothetical protein
MNCIKAQRFISTWASNHFAIFAHTYACFAVKKELRIYFKLIILIFCFSFNILDLKSQDEKISDIISSIAEELSDDENDPEAAAIYSEKLYDLIEKPVMINYADESELSRLFFLTDFQVKALAEYVHSTGKIISLYEIASVPGFDRELARMITPLISLDTEKRVDSEPVRLRNNLLSSFSVRFPDSVTSSTGPPWKSLIRYKFTVGSFSGGFTAEKDAGEKLLSGRPPLPDFLSASITWTGKGIVRKVIAGDFGARFGVGTSINTGLRTGLSLTQPGYLSGGDEIKSYTSTDENIFFRGAAAQFQIRKTGLSFLYSINRIDATVKTAENGSDLFIETFQKSGLHNSTTSLEKKDAVTENCFIINVSTDFKTFRTGIILTGSRFNLPVTKTDPQPEDIYDFEGTANITATAYYKAILGKMLFYGEGSSNLNQKLAFVQGVSFRPSDRLSINLLYRDYDPGFTSFHGKGLFSSSAGDNVMGVFGNFTFEAARHLFISAGCDLRYYPWIKYRCSAPSAAISREVRIKYLPSDKLTFEAVFNYRQSMLNREETDGIEKQENFGSSLIKGSVRYSPQENLTLLTRIDYKSAWPGRKQGMLLLQDLSYRFGKIPLSVWFRYCIFKTDDWYSRLYTYENDLLNSFSIPALSEEGNRTYLMVDWRAGKFIDLRIKYGITELLKDNDSCIKTEELKLQARIWF